MSSVRFSRQERKEPGSRRGAAFRHLQLLRGIPALAGYSGSAGGDLLIELENRGFAMIFFGDRFEILRIGQGDYGTYGKR